MRPLTTLTDAALAERRTELLTALDHSTNFTANIVTLLAEMRAGLSVWRPKAFVIATFDAAGL